MRITFLLVALNIAVFLLQIITFPVMDNLFAARATDIVNGAYWQPFTYMFLHDVSGIWHIFVNMLVLFIFGPLVERTIGKIHFVLLYFGAGVFSVLFYILTTGITSVPLVGASGAIFSIMAVYGLLYPKEIIIVMGIPMPALLAVVGLTGVQILFGVAGSGGNIAYFGHLGGIIAGAAFVVYWKAMRRQRKIEFIWQ